jgi:hypothetical protein
MSTFAKASLNLNLRVMLCLHYVFLLFSPNLVISRISVVLVWENELFPLEKEKVGAHLESRRLRAALAVAHVHHTVVKLLKAREKEIELRRDTSCSCYTRSVWHYGVGDDDYLLSADTAVTRIEYHKRSLFIHFPNCGSTHGISKERRYRKDRRRSLNDVICTAGRMRVCW